MMTDRVKCAPPPNVARTNLALVCWRRPSSFRRVASDGGELGDGYFIVAHAFVEVSKQRSGLGGDHGGLAVGSGEGVDSREGCPVGRDQNLHRAGNRTCANRCAKEAIDAL